MRRARARDGLEVGGAARGARRTLPADAGPTDATAGGSTPRSIDDRTAVGRVSASTNRTFSRKKDKDPARRGVGVEISALLSH